MKCHVMFNTCLFCITCEHGVTFNIRVRHILDHLPFPYGENTQIPFCYFRFIYGVFLLS